MASYDPGVIQQFADRLYTEAASTVIMATVLGAIVGLAGGASAGAAVASAPLPGGVVGAAIVGLIGFAWGTHRATALRLQAQMALCQMQIEWNTRRA